MKEIVSLKNIKVMADARDWKEAIEKAGNLLLEDKKINRKYIDDMINAVINMGPYMVLTPGFALAHAEPCPDVLKNGISVITLKTPVNFGSSNDPVKVILCLACTDSFTHISVLKIIAEKLMMEGMIERIASCKTEEEVYSLLNK